MAKRKKTQGDSAGRYAYEGLDRVLHEKARLSIMTSLAARPQGRLFNELRQLCSLTDGNLSRHLQTLEEAGLVEVWKGYTNRRPQTLCRLSSKGLKRFQAYLAELERVVQDAAVARREAAKGDRAARQRDMPKGWAPA